MTLHLARTTPIGLTVAAALTATLVAGAQASSSPEALLGAGLHQEEIEGNLEAAIATYSKVAGDPKASHPTVARALLQIGGCDEKLGRPDAARLAYERIVSQLADGGTPVTTARAKLAALTGDQSSPVGPFKERSLDQVFAGLDRPQISPDGKSVLYVVQTRSAAGSRGDPNLAVYLRDLAGGPARLLADSLAGDLVTSWSPDSQRIAVITHPALSVSEVLSANGAQTPRRGVGILTIVPIAASSARRWSSPMVNDDPSWSPDGHFFPYVAPTADPGVFELRLLDLRSGSSRSVKTTPRDTWGFRWSPDASQVTFRVSDEQDRNNRIHFVTVATGAEQVADLPGGSGPATSLGKLTSRGQAVNIAPPAAGAGMFLVSPDGARKVCDRTNSGDQCFDVARDGQSLIVQNGSTKKLALRDLTTATDTPLTTGAGEELHPYRSPDGRLEAFTSNREGRWAEYVVSLDHVPAQNPVRVAWLYGPSTSVAPTWTTAGVIFQVSDTELNVVRVDVDPNTGKATAPTERETLAGGANAGSSISPDSRRIAYWHQGPDTQNGLALVDAGGTNEHIALERLATGGIGATYWRSSDEVIAGKGGDGGAVLAINLTTGATRQVFRVGEDVHYWSYWSQGDEILYVSDHRLGEDASAVPGFAKYIPSAPRALYAHPLAGGPDRKVVDLGPVVSAPFVLLPAPFVVRPDNKAVAILRYRPPAGVDENNEALSKVFDSTISADIVLVPLDGGPERVLYSAEAPVSATASWSPLAWSPNGRFLLFKGAGGRLRIKDTQADQDWPLLDTPRQVPTTGGGWSPNGTFVVFSAADVRLEWRMFDGLTSDGVAKATASRR